MQVGDYVRTKKGEIVKVIDKKFDDTLLIDLYTTDKNYYLMEIDIPKSDPKLIKLIQVGDYVNGHRVYEVKENCVLVGYKCFKTEFDNEEDFLYQTIYEEDIKSIVTKEQFESMEYKVG